MVFITQQPKAVQEQNVLKEQLSPLAKPMKKEQINARIVMTDTSFLQTA